MIPTILTVVIFFALPVVWEWEAAGSLDVGKILVGVTALTGVIVLLVVVLMFCEMKLVKKGKVKLLINDDPAKSPEVDMGSNLLMALSNQKIFLPSACGGKGSCAMCKCQVFEGGGDILPSELTHIKKTEAKEGWRLSCQVKVRGPMKVKVPDAVFGIRKW
ncbi:MAG: 2Fe-2S iron-sulfur cluster-binding protein, partial [Aquabacterium sp.]